MRRLLVDDSGFPHELHPDSPPFAAGQQLIWRYRPQRRRSEIYAVAVEVVQVGRLRIRIRVRTASGTPLFRWVHAKNLRPRTPDEPAEPYPEPS
jgi:hypothetical protein